MPITSRARALRKQSTWAERRLWRLLRSRRLAGYKFRRQHHEGKYYLDFYCLEAKLAIESDGFGHGIPERQCHDLEQDDYLASRGILVKRVWNNQLVHAKNRESIVENLWRLLQQRAPHPATLLLRRTGECRTDPHPDPLPSDGRGKSSHSTNSGKGAGVAQYEP